MPTLLITGASTGIGAATARHAVEQGYDVALAARSRDKLDALVAEIGEERALAVECDVTDFSQQEAMAAKVTDRFGSIDAVFANAGVGASGSGTENGDPDNWRTMVETNVLGLMYTVKATHKAIEASRGHFLLTGSGAGRRPVPGSVYSATKWAVTGYGYNLKAEMREKGVKVTLIEPGMVDTPFFDERRTGALHADDIARAVVYALAQPDNVLASEIWIEPLNRG